MGMIYERKAAKLPGLQHRKCLKGLDHVPPRSVKFITTLELIQVLRKARNTIIDKKIRVGVHAGTTLTTNIRRYLWQRRNLWMQ